VRHRHVQQVAVDRGIRRHRARRLAGYGYAQQHREQDECRRSAAKHPQRISVAAPQVSG
jgi:hypothetical protein